MLWGPIHIIGNPWKNQTTPTTFAFTSLLCELQNTKLSTRTTDGEIVSDIQYVLICTVKKYQFSWLRYPNPAVVVLIWLRLDWGLTNWAPQVFEPMPPPLPPHHMFFKPLKPHIRYACSMPPHARDFSNPKTHNSCISTRYWLTVVFFFFLLFYLRK